MERPTSKARRRAWVNSSRQWPTLEELDPERPRCSLPSASISDDDVFSDGCFTGKIENWLLGCGSENRHQLSFESGLNFDDDLSLGADASVLNVGDIIRESGTPRPGLRLPSLNLGHSMTSSCPSSSTCKTTSSVSEVLQLCAEDAEETLLEMGFGCDEPQAPVRIPPRFFTFPSQAEGINFRLFLDAQLRRIREEDPGLSLASRFRQVQVLTAMANAFYSLYSHVSRTPLQKLAPPEFSLTADVDRIERFRSSIRSEPRSPVERLKDTVSKMCLYTGSPRGSDSTSPQPSPRKSSRIPDIVDSVLMQVKTGAVKKLDLEECNGSDSAADVSPVADDDGSRNSGGDEQTPWTLVDTDIRHHGNTICCQEMQSTKQRHDVDADENNVQPSNADRRTHDMKSSLASSLSGETVIEADRWFASRQAEEDSRSTQSHTGTDEIKPVATVTYDLICPQIVDSEHQTPLCRQHTHGPETHTGTQSTDKPRPESHEPQAHASASGPGEDSYTGDVNFSGRAHPGLVDSSRSLPVLAPSSSCTHCCITVTGSEGGDPSAPRSLNTPDSSHTSAVPPVRARGDSSNEGKTWYLNPPTRQGPGHFCSNVRQVHSFELEEVHSAGEEDFGQSDTTRTTTSPSSTEHQHKGEVVRGDSVQSDSSGYADEEVSPSSDRLGR